MKPVEVIRPASFIIGASAPNPTAFTPVAGVATYTP